MSPEKESFLQEKTSRLWKMGIVNLTPDSFSDGGKVRSLQDLNKQIENFGHMDILDVGAESTAPHNSPISAQMEWHRLEPFLSSLFSLDIDLSIDTYHPETIFKMAKIHQENHVNAKLIWNDVSGKFDDHAKRFLSLSNQFFYVYCHNLAPHRKETSHHMEYARESLSMGDLIDYFKPIQHERVIFDPCLGFSKSYEQNWMILHHFQTLQRAFSSNQMWLLGFSRKSFLKRKYQRELENELPLKLDQFHVQEILNLNLQGKIIIRTHAPELL